MNASNKERYMYVLGGFVVGSAAAVAILTIFFPIPESGHDIVVLAVGQLFILAGSVVGYFFGSSKSSSDKTALLANEKGEAPPPAIP